MRQLICDICAAAAEDQTDWDSYLQLVLLDDERNQIVLDICSGNCLKRFANGELDYLANSAEPEPAPEPELEDHGRFIELPKAAVFRPNSEADVERVTGVVRRGGPRS